MVRQRQGAKACFIAGTLVLTAEGLKKIEDIRVGDRVYAKDVEGGKQEIKEVLQTFEREVDVLVHLWIGGEEIVTTQTHPFYVEGKGWTEARELTEEDCVLDSKNEKLRVEGIRIEELREPVKVYNFEVEEYHTYYVGAAEVLVHNDNCGQGGKSKWWHEEYVDDLSDTQMLLGVKQSDKGLSTLGSATRKNTMSAGKAWVGDNYNTIKDNAGNVLGYSGVDGMRAVRIQYKPQEGMWRANFQENIMVNNPYPNPGQHSSQLKNVHIDILDQ